MHPVPQADPGLAIEPVALDRHLAGDDRVQHALAGILEAAFVDDPARGRVDDPVEACSTWIDGRAEGEVDQRVRGLRRIAALPVGLADPVAELQPAIGGVEAGAADEGAGAGERQRIGDAGPARAASWRGRRAPRPRHRDAACGPAFRRHDGCRRAATSCAISASRGARITSRSVTSTGQSIA